MSVVHASVTFVPASRLQQHRPVSDSMAWRLVLKEAVTDSRKFAVTNRGVFSTKNELRTG